MLLPHPSCRCGAAPGAGFFFPGVEVGLPPISNVCAFAGGTPASASRAQNVTAARDFFTGPLFEVSLLALHSPHDGFQAAAHESLVNMPISFHARITPLAKVEPGYRMLHSRCPRVPFCASRVRREPALPTR